MIKFVSPEEYVTSILLNHIKQYVVCNFDDGIVIYRFQGLYVGRYTCKSFFAQNIQNPVVLVKFLNEKNYLQISVVTGITEACLAGELSLNKAKVRLKKEMKRIHENFNSELLELLPGIRVIDEQKAKRENKFDEY